MAIVIFTRLYCLMLPERAGRALGRAAEDGDLTKVRALLAGGIRLAPDIHNRKVEPLLLAVSGGRKHVAQFLLANGADVNARCGDGKTPLHEAAFLKDRHREIAELLLAQGADVNARDNAGATPLHIAAVADSRRVAELLLAGGAQVDVCTSQGSTPLQFAAASGSKGMTELLLNKGAAVKTRDQHGRTPLHHLAVRSHRGQELVELVLANGAEINDRDDQGKTPLHLAAKEGSKRTVELLLSKGADIEAEDLEGLTAVECAASEAALLASKADSERMIAAAGLRKSPFSPSTGPLVGVRVQILELLLDEIDARNSNGRTPTRPGGGAREETALRLLRYGLLQAGLLVAGKEQEVRQIEEAFRACGPLEGIGYAAQVLMSLRRRRRSPTSSKDANEEVRKQ